MTDEATSDGCRVAAEITKRGYQPFVAGDHLDLSLNPEKAMVLIWAGVEHLARLGGAKDFDIASAPVLNRGLLELLRRRDRFGTGSR